MDLPVPILSHPERPFGPREPRVTAAAGRRDRREHTAGLRIDLLDAILGNLKQVLAVEGRSCMRGDINPAQRLPARPIRARPFLSHLDDDLAFCTSFFDVSQSLFGRFEWKDPIHHWAYDPRIDERTNLAQLVSACSHEKE